jgi:N-glycosylase/DNA lyase
MPKASANKLSRVAAPEFDLALTLGSGQVFHWSKSGDGFAGTIGEAPVYAEQRGRSLLVTPGIEKAVARYFALDHSPEKIHASFPDDPAMRAALESCRGMRIIRQPAWECLATFITSSMKQVAHIRQMSLAIRQRFGHPVQFGNTKLFTYPTPERLAAGEEQDLRECKLGYRAKNLIGTARMITAGEVNLERIRTLNDTQALKELCRLPGVGEKVANCVLLFAYERVRAFPIDVWIERVLRETYFKGKRRVTAARLRDFSQTYFGPFGGYAQQYLFHHARTGKKNESGTQKFGK